MHNPFQQVEHIKAEVLTALPARFRRKGRNEWTEANRGGIAGPDGIEMDAEDGLIVCHLGVGVYRFDNRMLPTHLVYSSNPQHFNLANVAFGGDDGRTLYIVQALTGEILVARMPVPGKKLYAHQ